MQDTCILHQKHFHAHCDVISDEYITDKVQNQGGGQYSFSSMFKYNEVVVGTDVNLLILLSKRSHHSNV